MQQQQQCESFHSLWLTKKREFSYVEGVLVCVRYTNVFVCARTQQSKARKGKDVKDHLLWSRATIYYNCYFRGQVMVWLVRQGTFTLSQQFGPYTCKKGYFPYVTWNSFGRIAGQNKNTDNLRPVFKDFNLFLLVLPHDSLKWLSVSQSVSQPVTFKDFRRIDGARLFRHK